MSHWDGKNIVAWPSRPWGKRGWERIDCGCCGGICWGGEEPIECNDCNGIGTLARFKKTGTIALYPGGPFKGKR